MDIKKNIIKILLLNLIFVVSICVLYSDNGENAAVFLKLDSDAKTAGMGGIGTVNNYGIINLERNPATLSYLLYYPYTTNRFLKFSHNKLIDDISGQYFQYTQNLGSNRAIGTYFKYIKISDITETDTYGQELGTFGSNYSAFGVSYASIYKDINLNYGVTLKSIEESIYTKKGRAFAIDLGVIYKPMEQLDLGFSVLNLGQKMKVYDTESSLPLTYNLGASYLFNESLLFLSEVEKEENIQMDLKFGTEYYLNDFFTVRGGLKMLGEEQLQKNFSLGFSFKYENMMLDYAYIPYEDLGDNHKISLSLFLGSD